MVCVANTPTRSESSATCALGGSRRAGRRAALDDADHVIGRRVSRRPACLRGICADVYGADSLLETLDEWTLISFRITYRLPGLAATNIGLVRCPAGMLSPASMPYRPGSAIATALGAHQDSLRCRSLVRLDVPLFALAYLGFELFDPSDERILLSLHSPRCWRTCRSTGAFRRSSDRPPADRGRVADTYGRKRDVAKALGKLSGVLEQSGATADRNTEESPVNLDTQAAG
jgi:hypothetical protein